MPELLEDRALRALQKLRPALFAAQDLPRSIEDRMAELCTPGASVSLIDNFEVLWACGFGTLASGSGPGATSSTLFQAGSISKLVFALAVVRLAQDGTVDLDADIGEYLTSWTIPAHRGWLPRLTLRQLLSHTAGTTVHGFPGYPIGRPRLTVREILQGSPPANTEPVVVNRLPGLQYQYSGGGTMIAQQAIVDRVGRPFPDLMRDLVFEPVGMVRSTYEQPLPTLLSQDAAIGHPWNGVPVPGDWHVYPEMAAAGLWTTAGDLARLGVDFLRALRGQTSALGLRQETAAAMLGNPSSGPTINREFVGLGWFCAGRDDNFHCGHKGGNEGFVAEMILLPACGKGAVVMLNSNQGAPLREELFASFGREYGWPERSPRISKDIVPLDNLSGVYRHPSGMALQIVEAKGALQLLFEHQPPLRMLPVSSNEFFASELDLRICFHRGTEGRAARATLVQGGSSVSLVAPSLEFARDAT